MEEKSKGSLFPEKTQKSSESEQNDSVYEDANRSRTESRKILKHITKRFYPVLRSAGLTHEDAEEVISTIGFKFLKNQHKILKSEPAFLYKIAMHELLNYVRKNGALKRSQVKSLNSPEQLELLAEGQTQASLRNLEFEDILKVLIPRQQEIVKLLLAGYSKVEIAVEIDIKPSTVSYHINKLRQNIFIQEILDRHIDRRDKEGNRDEK